MRPIEKFVMDYNFDEYDFEHVTFYNSYGDVITLNDVDEKKLTKDKGWDRDHWVDNEDIFKEAGLLYGYIRLKDQIWKVCEYDSNIYFSELTVFKNFEDKHERQ